MLGTSEYTYEIYYVDENENVKFLMFNRNVSDEFYAVAYVFDWMRTYEESYGNVIAINIHERYCPQNVILNIER